MRLALLALVGALVPFSALAVDAPWIYATVFGGARFGGSFASAVDGSERKLNDQASFGAAFDFARASGEYYALTYSRQRTTLRGQTPLDLTVEYFHAGGVLDFGDPEAHAIPYLSLTVGVTHISPTRADLNNATEFSIGGGGGLKIPLSARVALRIDARVYVTPVNSRSSIFCATGGSTNFCDVRVHGDSFVQGEGSFGMTVGF